jgi:hypothetical protein
MLSPPSARQIDLFSPFFILPLVLRVWLGRMIFFVMAATVVLSFVMLTLVMFTLVMLNCVMFTLVTLTLLVFTLLMITCPGLGHPVRVPVIHRVALIRVMTSILFMSALTIGCLHAPFMLRRLFLGSWSRIGSARAVEAGVIINVCPVVDNRTVNIGIMDDRRIHFPNCRIVMKGAAFPSATVKA